MHNSLDWNRIAFLVAAVVLFTIVAATPWHADTQVRRATALVLVTLLLWITEAVPLGVTGLLIPVGATFVGVLKWHDALSAWSDPILFLFLGAFLLARALEKHGVFNFLIHGRWLRRWHGTGGVAIAVFVMLVAGLISTMQSNTATAAMLVPLVVALARTVRQPAIVLLALSYGATFGGMATPIGTPPNLIGYAAMQKLDPNVNFISWLRVGLPVWIGTTLITWAALALLPGRPRRATAGGLADDALPIADIDAEPEVSATTPAAPRTAHVSATTQAARRWSIAAFALTVLVWLTSGFVVSLAPPDHPAQAWVHRYLPESLPPLVAAGLLFFVRVGPQRTPVLQRRDFQILDWDTLFLIAGGLCLGQLLQASGTAAALAAAISHAPLPPLVLMFGLGAVTLILSELTSNTATGALMVPIAASLAPAVHLSPVTTIWLVALSASLGFALPVSTPPNAIVYGTRLVPLRTMATRGLLVDALSLVWVVTCVYWLAG